MNLDFAIALPHTILLSIYLLLLIYTLAKDYSLGDYRVIVLIILESYWSLQFGTGNMYFHTAFDLVALIGISSIFFLVKKKRLKWTLLVLSYLGFVGAHLHVSDSSRPLDKEIPHQELLVQFSSKDHLQKWVDDNRQNLNLTYPLFTPEDETFLLDEYVMVSLPSSSVTSFYSDYEYQYGIEHIEYNDAVFADQEILKKGRINDPLLEKQWMADPYQLDKLHKLTSQKKFVAQKSPSVIAILDTGVDAEHEDLKANYISISSRYDRDTKGHGTHCAGIAAAVSGNNVGIASLIPPHAPVKVTSIKVLNNFGAGTQKTIIDGIIKAADEGCSVISMSLGGITSDSKEKAYTEAVRYANAKGAIVIVAAGNSGKDARAYNPANIKGVIAVTALDSLMEKAPFGNDVSQLYMGLAAPGSGIYSTCPDDKYQSFNGTSMAAPFISGLVGLMKAYEPSLTTEEVYTLIYDTAIKRDGLIIADPLATMQILFSSHLEG